MMSIKVIVLRLLAPIFWSVVWAGGAALGATSPIVVGLSPRADYSTVCVREPTTLLTYDWATWPGGPPPMALDRMYADALGYQSGSADLPRDPVLARRMFTYLATAEWEKQGDATYQLAQGYLDKALDNYDPLVAVQLLNAAVDLGSSRAAMLLGRLFLNGKDVQKDEQAAKRFLSIAAADGEIEALLSLSRLYLERPDLQESQTASSDYLKLAVLTITTEVAAGHCSALSFLGDIYANDDFALYDPTAAVAWYEAAFNAGDLDAILPLAHFYRFGEGVQPDIAKAVSLLTLAANSHEPSAMADLGEMLLQTQDPDRIQEGISWLKKAADNYDPRGFELLSQVARGDYGQAPDPVAAFEYLSRAAAFPSASPDVLLRLADAYLRGEGTAPDAQRAYELYYRAASLGDPKAYVAMFDLRENEAVTGTSNPILLLRTAAGVGDGDAMIKLADAYACGIQVDRSMETSELWLERAASVGASAAMRKLAMAARRSEDTEHYLRLLNRAAQSEDPDSMVLLGWTYLHGLEVPVDQSKGQHWIDAALSDQAIAERASIALARLVAAGAADVPPNPERAKQYLLAVEGAGNSSLMYELGKLYSLKGATTNDQEKARGYFVNAARLGHVAAMLQLVELRVTTEEGGGKDWTTWLSDAVATGDVRAIVTRSELATELTERHALFEAALDRNICDGKDLITLAGALKDDPTYLEQTRSLLQRAIDLGIEDGGALFSLGQMMRQGLAGEEWIEPSVDYLVAAANAGKVEAAREVGRTLLGSRGAETDFGQATRWLLQAAQGGDEDAIEDLAGLVTDPKVPAQVVRSIIEQLETSIDRRSQTGLLALATFYGELSNVDLRYAAMANEMLESAAAQGNGEAMLQLADHYGRGIGVEQSAGESTRWLKRAAELGFPPAYARYAIALQLGIGLQADPDEARIWLERATQTASAEE